MQIFYFYLLSGIILIVSEILFTTFYLLVIGIVFILSGLLALIIPSWETIGVLSVVLSIISCIMLKMYKQKHKSPTLQIGQHIGHTVEVIEIINNKLRVKYSGSYWDAVLKHKNMTDIKIGDTLTITKFHNNEFELD